MAKPSERADRLVTRLYKRQAGTPVEGEDKSSESVPDLTIARTAYRRSLSRQYRLLRERREKNG